MELTWSWMTLALFGVLGLAVVVALLIARRRLARDRLAAAHVERLTSLPGYARARRRSLVALIAFGITALIALGGLAFAAGRPVTTDVVRTDKASRDIVLCLDVSGSMLDSDADVLRTFRTIVAGFRGERISLVIFNASAVQVFPLTDDYTYVDGQLAAAQQAAESGGYSDAFDLLGGTLVGDGTYSSAVGDGLGSCVLRFDQADKKRSRTIVLATDNEVRGRSILTLDEATRFAMERKVRVYALTPESVLGPDDVQRQMSTEVEKTGGKMYGLGASGAADDIVKKVLADQAKHLTGALHLVVTDTPGAPLLIAMIAMTLVAIAGWRVRS